MYFLLSHFSINLLLLSLSFHSNFYSCYTHWHRSSKWLIEASSALSIKINLYPAVERVLYQTMKFNNNRHPPIKLLAIVVGKHLISMKLYFQMHICSTSQKLNGFCFIFADLDGNTNSKFYEASRSERRKLNLIVERICLNWCEVFLLQLIQLR